MIRFSVARLEKEPIELVGSEPAEFLEIEPTGLLAVSAPASPEPAAAVSNRSKRRSSPTISVSFSKSETRRRWIFPRTSVPKCFLRCR